MYIEAYRKYSSLLCIKSRFLWNQLHCIPNQQHILTSGNKVIHTAKNSFRRSSMLPLWMVNKAAAIWLMAFAKQWMLLQCPKQKQTQITSALRWKRQYSLENITKDKEICDSERITFSILHNGSKVLFHTELAIWKATRSTALPSNS